MHRAFSRKLALSLKQARRELGGNVSAN